MNDLSWLFGFALGCTVFWGGLLLCIHTSDKAATRRANEKHRCWNEEQKRAREEYYKTERAKFGPDYKIYLGEEKDSK